MKKALFSIIGIFGFSLFMQGQDQLLNWSFENWKNETCGETTFESLNDFTSFIGPCASFSFNGETTYNLDLHIEKVQGAKATDVAAKFYNTQSNGSVNSTTYLNISDDSKLDKINSLPKSVSIASISNMLADDSATVSIFLYKGSENVMEAFTDIETQTTHNANFTFSKKSNTSDFIELTIPFSETDVAMEPDHAIVMINTHSNEEKGHAANIDSYITLDYIKFNYESQTTPTQEELSALINLQQQDNSLIFLNESTTKVDVNIYNNASQLIGSLSVQPHDTNSTHALEEGIYIIVYTTVTEAFTKKVIIQ